MLEKPWELTLSAYVSRDPKFLEAQRKLEKAYEALRKGRSWGDTRRFAGRSARNRLEAILRGRERVSKAWENACTAHEREVRKAAALELPIAVENRIRYGLEG